MLDASSVGLVRPDTPGKVVCGASVGMFIQRSQVVRGGHDATPPAAQTVQRRCMCEQRDLARPIWLLSP